MSRTKTSQDARADVFTVIAHPVRRELLSQLTEGKYSVKELAEPFDITRSAISQHLSILLDSGLVAAEQSGREHTFALRPEGLFEVYRWLGQFERFWPEKLDELAQFLDGAESEEST